LVVFGQCGVRSALEVYPTEIAFDSYKAQRVLEALDYREEFGFNFDPSHLHWQGVEPVEFIRAFPDPIFHVHVKDAIKTLDGRSGILACHLNLGDHWRGWDFCSPGRSGIDFGETDRALNDINIDLTDICVPNNMHAAIVVEEAYRFDNRPVLATKRMYWDLLKQWTDVPEGLRDTAPRMATASST